MMYQSFGVVKYPSNINNQVWKLYITLNIFLHNIPYLAAILFGFDLF